jgi:hypothetical protein
MRDVQSLFMRALEVLPNSNGQGTHDLVLAMIRNAMQPLLAEQSQLWQQLAAQQGDAAATATLRARLAAVARDLDILENEYFRWGHRATYAALPHTRGTQRRSPRPLFGPLP